MQMNQNKPCLRKCALVNNDIANDWIHHGLNVLLNHSHFHIIPITYMIYWDTRDVQLNI